MEFYDIEEIVYLNNSSALFQKIEEIKSALHKMDCTTDIPSMLQVGDRRMKFDIRISFPLPQFCSVGNLNSEPGENLPPSK